MKHHALVRYSTFRERWKKWPQSLCWQYDVILQEHWAVGRIRKCCSIALSGKHLCSDMPERSVINECCEHCSKSLDFFLMKMPHAKFWCTKMRTCWSFYGLKVLLLDLEHATIQSIRLATENVIKQLLCKLREFADIWGILPNQIIRAKMHFCTKSTKQIYKEKRYTETENGEPIKLLGIQTFDCALIDRDSNKQTQSILFRVPWANKRTTCLVFGLLQSTRV